MRTELMFLAGLFLCVTLMLAGRAAAMQALDDVDLEGIGARDGIAVSMDFRINAQADGSRVLAAECPAVGALSGGSSCRLAISLADQAGMWVVMKDYRGLMRLTNVHLDASSLPGTWTTHTQIGGSQNPYLNGYDPRGKPAIRLASGPWAVARAGTLSTYNAFLNQSAYQDFLIAIDVPRLSAEFDCGAALNAAAGLYVTGCSSGSPGWDGVDRVPGYLRDAIPGAAISLRMAHGISAGALLPTAPARFRLDGHLQVFGY